jgi:tetratricopeptide (TPR) repeat protein
MSQQPQIASPTTRADLTASIEAGRRALAERPGDIDALAGLAHLLVAAGIWGEAGELYRQALKLAPEREDVRQGAARVAAAMLTRAQACQQAGDAERAIHAYRVAIALDPRLPIQAYLGLGVLMLQKGDAERALAVFRKACDVYPDRPAAHLQSGRALQDLRRFEEAIAAFRRAVELGPGSVAAARHLADLLIKEGHLDEALDVCRRIQMLLPDEPSAIANEAFVLELKGEPQRAYDLLLPLIRGGKITSHVALAFGTVCQRLEPPSDEALPLLRDELGKPELQGESRARMLRTYSALCNVLGLADEAFAALREAKQIDADRFEDSKDELLGIIDRSLTCFSKERMARLPRARHGSKLPIFIVGMPRSGTSLAEQILSSHPRVFGAGELTTIIGLARTALGTGKAYPECFDSWTPERVEGAAEHFMKQLRALAPSADRITDKMPFNFLHLGMIEVLFPGARVIHCSRNALDTCVSCYFMEFSPKLSIFNDLATVGRYYRGYRAVMEHWKKVLTIPVFELNYERLLADPERIVREMVAFCDLEWNDACMKFHESRRHVKTFSYHQVRKPLYTASIGRYRVYDSHLGPLKEALGPALVKEAEIAE